MKYIVTTLLFLGLIGCKKSSFKVTETKEAVGPAGPKGDTGPQGPAGLDGKDGTSVRLVQTPEGVKIITSDGQEMLVKNGTNGLNGNNGADGRDGIDGKDGEDGKDAVVLTQVKVPAGKCVQVHRLLYVENIEVNGEHVFDVYTNSQCRDNLGEVCDNVVPSYGVSGSVDSEEHAGSGTTCWADNIEIQGNKPLESDRDLIIKVKEFTE